ncbi:MAG TPA: chitosanase [Clostridiaceae bacterium]
MRKTFNLLIASIFALLLLSGCAADNSNTNNSNTTDTTNSTNATNTADNVPVASELKKTCLQLTTACENGSTFFNYNYAENIDDGRGITFGIIGFTTGTYDGNELIKYYTQLNPNNNLAKYISALDKIDSGKRDAEDKSADVTGLANFINDVKACDDPLFKKAQLYELDAHYWNPAVKLADSIGAKNNLTLAFIYDTCVNHGADGAQDFINEVKGELNGTPAIGTNENEFLSVLMDNRYNYLKKDDPDGAKRVKAYEKLLTDGNVDLKTPFEFTVFGGKYKIDGNVY